MTPEELRAIRSNVEQASPGPWTIEDAFVLTTMHEDFATLLAEVERLQAENTALRHQLETIKTSRNV